MFALDTVPGIHPNVNRRNDESAVMNTINAIRILAVVTAVGAVAGPVEAGRRCGARYYQAPATAYAIPSQPATAVAAQEPARIGYQSTYQPAQTETVPAATVPAPGPTVAPRYYGPQRYAPSHPNTTQEWRRSFGKPF